MAQHISNHCCECGELNLSSALEILDNVVYRVEALDEEGRRLKGDTNSLGLPIASFKRKEVNHAWQLVRDHLRR